VPVWVIGLKELLAGHPFPRARIGDFGILGDITREKGLFLQEVGCHFIKRFKELGAFMTRYWQAGGNAIAC